MPFSCLPPNEKGHIFPLDGQRTGSIYPLLHSLPSPILISRGSSPSGCPSRLSVTHNGLVLRKETKHLLLWALTWVSYLWLMQSELSMVGHNPLYLVCFVALVKLSLPCVRLLLGEAATSVMVAARECLKTQKARYGKLPFRALGPN